MRRPLALAAVTVLLAAACSDDDGQSSDSTLAASTAATSSTAPESTAATSSTEAATTAAPATVAATTEPAPTTAPTVPPTTVPTPPTTAAEPATLVLMSTGIGSVAFGTPEAEALAALEGQLGPVSSEITNSYPNDLGDGNYLDDAGVDAFAYRAHRTACFDNALCVVFGGDAPDSLAFVGWVQNNQGVDPPLSTATGITAGSMWADHVDDIEIAEFGCYSIGYGTTDGVSLLLSSAGDPFSLYDEDGNAVATRPDPADVTVIELEAGDHPFFVGDDC